MSDGNLGKTVGAYTLFKFLGAGQFGSVYLAHKKGEYKDYAVKIVDKSKVANPMLKDMLESEVAIMQKINHPNVIHLYDF